jgi:hypothetical protein
MSKDLINVIEDLLEDTAPTQEPTMKEDNIQEADQNAVNAKNLTSDGKTADMATIKPGSDKESGTAEPDKEISAGAGPSVDTGNKNKGEIASDASAEVEADKGPHDQSTSNAGDTNSIDGITAKGSDASTAAEPDKGPHNQEMDEAKKKNKLDPVGKADGDIDNDGDEDESDDYLHNRRGAIKKSMSKEEVTFDDAMYVLHAEELVVTESSNAWDWNKLKDLDEESWYSLVNELTEEESQIFSNELAEMAAILSESEEDEVVEEVEAIEEPVVETTEEVAEVEEDAALTDAEKAKKIAGADAHVEDMGEETVDEALPAGEPMKKLATSSGQDTAIQADANIKDLPPEEKEAAKGKSATKAGDPNTGPHSQANDPIDTPTKANPKGTAEEVEIESSEDDVELEEDFKRKAAVVFETAVNEKVDTIVETIKVEYDTQLEEEKVALNAKINDYVDYAVKDWIEENQLEIKYSLRTEVAESFISGMRKLFAENYIDIPEDDISVVDELTEQIDSFKEQAEEQQAISEQLQKEVLEFKRTAIVEEVSSDLTQTQKIRLEKLAESVEATDTEEFQAKLNDLKDAYFTEAEESSKLLTSLSEEVIGTDEVNLEESINPSMNAYAQFLSKTISK